MGPIGNGAVGPRTWHCVKSLRAPARPRSLVEIFAAQPRPAVSSARTRWAAARAREWRCVLRARAAARRRATWSVAPGGAPGTGGRGEGGGRTGGNNSALFARINATSRRVPRSHPCSECVLMRYVPESRKGEDVPCHHIPLDQKSRTIATLDATKGEEILKRWLRHEISRLEAELAP